MRAIPVGLVIVLLSAPVVPAHGQPSDAPLTFHNCVSQFAGFPSTRDDALAHTPPGFTPAPFSFDSTGVTGSWTVYVNRCSEARNASGESLGPVQESWLLLRVGAPSVWQDPDVNAYFVALHVGADTSELVGAYKARGIDAAAVDVDGMPVASPPLESGQMTTVRMDGWQYDMLNPPTATTTPWGPFTMRLFFVDASGTVTGAVDHIETPGRSTRAQPSTIAVADGAPYFPGVSPGLGRTFSWPDSGPSWTVETVP